MGVKIEIWPSEVVKKFTSSWVPFLTMKMDDSSLDVVYFLKLRKKLD